MSIFEAIILGLVQGLTEFIPVSSSGHLILAREFFGFSTLNGLAYDAVLQLATVFSVLAYYLYELPQILKDKKLLLAIVLGTLPAVILGFILEEKMETVFRSAHLVAWTLLLGALLMYLAERLSKTALDSITPQKGLLIGFFQSLALVPGISRSGATISGGLFAGLSREASTRFSFLLSTPILLGTGLKKLLDLSSSGELSLLGTSLLLGSIAAFLSGLWAVSFLISYLKNHQLTPFIRYRVVLALVILIFL
jgi:undecaprenyl-diphosphatase